MELSEETRNLKRDIKKALAYERKIQRKGFATLSELVGDRHN